MAIIKCSECGNDISDKVENCPKCGAKPPRKMGMGSTIILGALGLSLALWAIGGLIPQEPPAQSMTTAQDAAKAIEEFRFQKTAAAANIIKRHLRDPRSVEWAGFWANDDASVICIEYRARNEFGGMNHEHVSIAGAVASQDAAAWNRHCTVKLHNMRHVRHAIQ